MNIKTPIPEIEIKLSYPTRYQDRIKINSAEKLKEVLESVREPNLIEYRESLYLLVVDSSLHVLGYRQMFAGGITATYVDVRQMLAIALKANATGIIIAHNHPS